MHIIFTSHRKLSEAWSRWLGRWFIPSPSALLAARHGLALVCGGGYVDISEMYLKCTCIVIYWTLWDRNLCVPFHYDFMIHVIIEKLNFIFGKSVNWPFGLKFGM